MAAAMCYGVGGGGAQLCFHVQPGNYDTDSLIEVLGELRKFLGGEKATLLWDGLPAHRSTRDAGLAGHPAVLAGGRAPAGLRARPQPGRGPVVQPQGVELANLTTPTLAEVIDQAHRGIERVRRTPHLAYSFLRQPACRSHDTRRPPDLQVGERLRGIPWSPGTPVRRSRGAMARSLRRIDWAALGANVGSAVLFTLLLIGPLPRGGPLQSVAARAGHRNHPGPVLLPAAGALQRARPRRRRHPVSTLSSRRR